MYRNALLEPAEKSRRFEPADIAMAMEYRQRFELASRTRERLVTWDVAGHAQCEKDRMYSVYRLRGSMYGGY